MSSNRSTSISDHENINSNSICRDCLTSLKLIREISSEYCSECYNNHRISIRSLSFSMISREGSLLRDIRENDLHINTSRMLSKIDQNKIDLTEHSKSLKNNVDDYFKAQIKILSEVREKITHDLNALELTLRGNLHKTNLSGNTSHLRILRKIIKNKPLKTCQIAKIFQKKDELASNISASSVKINYKIEEFFIEPILVFFSGSSSSELDKFQVYIDRFSNFPLMKEKSFEKRVLKKTCSFIEYERGSIFFVGNDGSWLSSGLWKIDYSKKDSSAVRISNSPRVKNASLEYHEPNLIMIGGKSKFTTRFHFNSYEWKQWVELPAVLGTTHSTRINEIVVCVGNKYQQVVFIDIVKERFRAYGLNIGKKLVFSYQQNYFVFNRNDLIVADTANDEILTYKHSLYEECSVLRCPGKAKLIYPYLYFMTINKKHSTGNEFSVWRFSVISYDLTKLK